jgi:hypothetical protein
MAQSGFTPIQIYHSTTAGNTPLAVDLANGELAINTNDGILYYKDSGGVVQVLASGSSVSVSAVLVATTANITLSGAQTIDTVAVVAGNRVLVKNQTSSQNNGLYVASAGAWTRAIDANASAEIAGRIVSVQSGSANGGEQFATTFKSTDTLGTTAMPWYQVALQNTAVTFTDLTATGVANFSDGTAALPSITNTGDTNTGIYFPAADTIAFTEGGVESMRIDSSGNLLLGVTDSRTSGGVTAALQVESTTVNGGSQFLTVNNATAGNGPLFSFNRSRGTALGDVTAVAQGDTLGRVFFAGADGTNLIAAASISSQVDATPGTNDMPGRLIFSTTADGASTVTERMRIDSAGNVGIGSTSPVTKLEVAGSNASTWSATLTSISGTTMTIAGTVTGTIAIGDIVYGTGVQPYTRITAGSALSWTVSVSQTVASATLVGGATYSSTLIRIKENDGTVNAGQPIGGLQFFTTDSSAPTAGVGAYVASLAESATPDTALVFGTRDNGGGVDANERMRITSAGSVYIGKATGNYTFEVLDAAGSSIVGKLNTAGTGAYLAFGDATSSSLGNAPRIGAIGDAVVTFTTGSERMRIDSTGNVGIGTSSPNNLLQIDRATSLDTSAITNGRGTLYLSAAANSTNSTGQILNAISFSGQGSGRRRAMIANLQSSASSTTGGDIAFYNSASATATDLVEERMRIDSSGNVGIGTSSPTNTLSVTGTANVTGNVTLGDATTDTVTVNGYVGVGGAGATTTGLKVVSAALTGTAQDGIQSAPVATSAATSQVRAFTAIPGTAAAAFTCTTAYGFRAFDASTGAGSTITNLYGVYVNDLTQATNNYGIGSVVSSGTNKFNIYASGTADNYFAGNVGIGTTSPTAVLNLKAGTATASTSPLKFTSGTNLTSAEAGSVEYDGNVFYGTADVTSGRGLWPTTQYFRLTADGTAIGPTIANFFGATSGKSLDTSAFYEVEYNLYFTKTTAGTVTFTLTYANAPINCNANYVGTPVGGVGTVGSPQTAALVKSTATASALPVTGSLTTGVNHQYVVKAIFQANATTGGTLNLQVTSSAGTVTPLTGSYYKVTRLPAANTGAFA